MELWDVYDDERKLIGRTCVRGEAMKPGDNHLVVEVWIINDQHQILITKRDPKKHYGNLWECTGGAAIAGETSLQAVHRELLEETGIAIDNSGFELIHTTFCKERNLFLDTYICRTTAKITEMHWQETEVIDGRYVTIKELDEMIAEKIVAPPVIQQYYTIRDRLIQEERI